MLLSFWSLSARCTKNNLLTNPLKSKQTIMALCITSFANLDTCVLFCLLANDTETLVVACILLGLPQWWQKAIFGCV